MQIILQKINFLLSVDDGACSMEKPLVKPEAEACSDKSAGHVVGVSAVLTATLVSLNVLFN